MPLGLLAGLEGALWFRECNKGVDLLLLLALENTFIVEFEYLTTL